MKNIEFPNGDQYESEVKDFKPYGKGTMYFNNVWDTVYVGEWVKGARTGKRISRRNKVNLVQN